MITICGASGFGREVAWLVERINAVQPVWNLVGFLDDDDSIQASMVNGYRVLGKLVDAGRYPEALYVCAVGSSRVREAIVGRMRENDPDVRFATLVDPAAGISNLVTIGEGTILCAHTIVTVNVSIGSHVIINLDCTVGHDAVLNDFVTLYPSVNVSGNVCIGRGSELGTGMVAIQGKTVGEYAIVGAGAVVVKDIPAKCTAVGSPAKPIKFIE